LNTVPGVPFLMISKEAPGEGGARLLEPIIDSTFLGRKPPPRGKRRGSSHWERSCEQLGV